MIQATQSVHELLALLPRVKISDKTALRENAGFNPDSELAGTERKTFSLIIQPRDIDIIQEHMQDIYDYICSDLSFSPSPTKPYPFDYMRLDAFYDASSQQLSVLEINARGAGMHEISELCDINTATTLGLAEPVRLNDRIVTIQKALHEAAIGPVENLLYITKPGKSKWLYYEAIERAYPNVAYVTDTTNLRPASTGINYNNHQYRAITTKASGVLPSQYWKLDRESFISIMQPKIARRVGLKNYLHDIPFTCIPKSYPLNRADQHNYLKNQPQLVLKKNKSSNSAGVIVGKFASPEQWKSALEAAFARHDDWLMQEFVSPSEGVAIGHDGSIIRNNKILLGIFIIPDTNDSSKITIDISAKLFNGEDADIRFDPADIDEDIWFGNVVVAARDA